MDKIVKGISMMLIGLIVMGCSFHFREGKRLEAEERWEEASIEYRLAFVDDPDDEEVIAALNRTNKEVAKENLKRYEAYLEQKEFRKAYRRLEAAAIQDPSLEEVQAEHPHWHKILVAGKIKFQLDRLQANIRLADQMQLQIQLNTPSGKLLTANISNESGIFFAEDVLYKPTYQNLSRYSINAIGLKLSRVTPEKRTKHEFKRFINFRGLIAEPPIGELQENASNPIRNVLDHRPQLLSTTPPPAPWFPPRLIRHYLVLKGSEIQVASSAKRADFAPTALYVNNAQQRVFVDFGVYQLVLDNASQRWSIQKQAYATKEDDYFYQFSKNLALYPYFFYRDGVYRYTVAQ